MSSDSGSGNVEVLSQAIQAVVADNRAVGREEKSLALLLEKIQEASMPDLYNELFTALNSCFDGRKVKLKSTIKERAHKKFHSLRIGRFGTIWGEITTDLGIPALQPLEYQAISRHLFNHAMIEYFKEHFGSEHCGKSSITLLVEEDNALRYASGYVAMRLSKKFERKSGDKAAQFVECLSQMANMGSDTSFYQYTKEWVESINRGGLFLTNDTTLMFFRAMELKVQELLPDHIANSGGKQDLISSIASDSDVDFHWCLLAVDIREEEDAAELLHRVIEAWLTMRGFAISSMWLEEYKRATKQNLKKEKSLRKELEKKDAQPDDNTQQESQEPQEGSEDMGHETEETEELQEDTQ